MAWSKEWINYLNLETSADPGSKEQPPGKIDVYPLQFANCDRLENNEAVYIFDEVGSGKTISAGLMALHYLYEHKDEQDKKVLIITVNALVKTGQFQRDWRRLPFEALGLWDRVTVINNHYSNIQNHKGKWGLVIIDEAHKFLNEENKMNKALCDYSFKAEKVVFLTATPVKSGETDLHVYERIARALLHQELPKDQYDVPWIDMLCTSKRKQSDSNNPDLICSQFCEKSPVTRYFKDTIRALQTDEMKKIGPRRLLADVWNYKYEWDDKDSILLDNINKELCKDKNRNRFVVFVRYVENEAKKLERLLLSKGFESYEKNGANKQSAKTVAVVTGSNSRELERYSEIEPDKLPTVLILTYQVAEQGVNLPGYNHVVNYHIPAYPSSLEQRFGRVDRLKSKSTEISIHFLVSNAGYDNNTGNFHFAVRAYIHALLRCVPAKNTILTEQILDEYLSGKKVLQERAKQIGELVQKEENLRRLIVHASKQAEESENASEESAEDNLADLADLTDLTEYLNLELSEYSDTEDSIKKLQCKITAYLEKINQEEELPDDVVKALKGTIKRSSGDSIFYLKEDPEKDMPLKNVVKKLLCTTDAVAGTDEKPGCAARINSLGSYRKYYEEFQSKIAPALAFSEHRDELEEIYERRFRDNSLEDIFCLENIFRVEGYSAAELKDYWENCFNKNAAREICREVIGAADKDSDKKSRILYDFLRRQYMRLPFFQMCKKFQELLVKHAGKEETSNKTRGKELVIKHHFMSSITKPKEKCGSEREFQEKRGIKEEFFYTDNPLQIPLRELAKIIKNPGNRNDETKVWAPRLTKDFSNEISAMIVFDPEEPCQYKENCQYKEDCRYKEVTYRIKEEAYQIKTEKQGPKASNWLRLAYLLTGNVKAMTYGGATTVFKGFLFQAKGLKRNSEWTYQQEIKFRSQDITETEWKQALMEWKPDFEGRGRLIEDIFDLDMVVLDLDMTDTLDYIEENRPSS